MPDINWDSVVRNLIDTVVPAALDPAPVRFSAGDEVGIPVVRAAFARSGGDRVRLRRPLNRKAFLLGCLDLTEEAHIEHLVAGFGRRHGSTTKIDRIAGCTGGEGSVQIPPELLHLAQRHVAANRANEVLLYHNHPRWPLNALVDNIPLASKTDRTTLVDVHRDPFVLLKTLFGGGHIRFFLGENGFVREVRTPNIVDLLQRLGARRPG